MNKRTMTSAVLLATLVGSIWLWGGGCDVTRIEQVDEESIALVEGLLAALSNADTYAKSEAAINTVLEMTGVGMPESPSPYGSYVLTDEERSSLAQAHVRFVKRELAPEPSLGNSYEKTSSAGLLFTTDLDETLEILEELANDALAEPVEPGKLLLIVIATEGSELPYIIDDQHSDRIISPVQEFLFVVWLREHGLSMESYFAANNTNKTHGMGELFCTDPVQGDCEDGQFAVCKKSKKSTKCVKKCRGGVTSLTLEYNGPGGNVTAKSGTVSYTIGTLSTGNMFTITGTKSDGKFDTNEVEFFVDGQPVAVFHVSCSDVMDPGITEQDGNKHEDPNGKVDFTVVKFISKDGGLIDGSSVPLPTGKDPTRYECGVCHDQGGST